VVHEGDRAVRPRPRTRAFECPISLADLCRYAIKIDSAPNQFRFTLTAFHPPVGACARVQFWEIPQTTTEGLRISDEARGLLMFVCSTTVSVSINLRDTRRDYGIHGGAP
jgi:hypothetical protein